MAAVEESYNVILMAVKKINDEGYIARNVDVADATGMDSNYLFKPLHDLADHGFLEKLKDGARLLFRLPGRTVTEIRPTRITHREKKRRTENLTVDYLRSFAAGNVGAAVEYVVDTIQANTGKAVVLDLVKAKAITNYLVILSNGHTCTHFEFWQWMKKRIPVGESTITGYVRIERWKKKR